LGGALTSSPDASSCGVGHLDIYATGAGNALIQLGFNGKWAAWRNLGGQWTSAPGAVCLAGSTTVNVFERGVDNAAWYTSLAGS
jgi:hypothetical protein